MEGGINPYFPHAWVASESHVIFPLNLIQLSLNPTPSPLDYCPTPGRDAERFGAAGSLSNPCITDAIIPHCHCLLPASGPHLIVCHSSSLPPGVPPPGTVRCNCHSLQAACSRILRARITHLAIHDSKRSPPGQRDPYIHAGGTK